MSPDASLGRRLVRRARRLIGGARPSTSQQRGPRVSVVVDVRPGDLPFLPECVASVLRQRPKRLEVLLVPRVGADHDLVRAVAADERVRLAADAGEARGTYVSFLRGCDTLARGALQALVAALDEHGCDVALGRTRTYRGRPNLSALEHATRCTDLDADPSALTDPWLGGRLVRRTAWEALGPEPPATGPAPDPAGLERALLVLLRTQRFCLVDRVVHERHERGAGQPIGTIVPLVPSVGAFAAVLERLDAEVAGRSAAVQHAWDAAVLSAHLPRYVEDVERAGPDDRDLLHRLVRDRVERHGGVPRDADADVQVELALAAAGRLNELEDLVASRWYERPHLPTRLDHDVTRPAAGWPRVAATELEEVVLPARQTPLALSLRSVAHDDAGATVTCWAALRRIDHGPGADVEASVVLVSDEVRRELAVEVRDHVAVTRWAGDRYQDHDRGVLEVRVPAAVVAEVGDRARLEVELAVGGERRRGSVAFASGELSGGRTTPEGAWTVTGCEVVAGRLRVTATGGAASWTLRLVGPVTVEATAVGEDVVEYPLTVSRWGGPELALPSGQYRLDSGADGSAVTAVWSADQRARADERLDAPGVRIDLRRGGGAWLVLRVEPPVGDDEVGARAQERLRTAAVASSPAVDDGVVYLQSYDGRTAVDSPLAIHRELVRRGDGRRLVWGVADLSTRLPDGAEPVVIGSRAWHEVVARAGHLVSNVDFDRRVSKRDGQRFLQTFHGYPSKAMGRGLWEVKGFTPRRIASERRRTVLEWDAITVPTPAMAVHYREQYDYEGTVLEHGLPRDDALVAPEAGEVRDRTRALLGIRPDQVAVLYAPTWRDDVATGYESAPGVTHLDPAAATAALGDRYVLLVRGHRFHRDAAGPGDRVVDVGSYPDVNDLILASDVGVFDYSSIRFDFALTGRPMLFLVPDLAEYTGGGRGFLFPFEDSAPGPLLSHADDVVERLRDVDGLARSQAEPLRVFNETYNPYQDGRATARVVDAFLG